MTCGFAASVGVPIIPFSLHCMREDYVSHPALQLGYHHATETRHVECGQKQCQPLMGLATNSSHDGSAHSDRNAGPRWQSMWWKELQQNEEMFVCEPFGCAGLLVTAA